MTHLRNTIMSLSIVMLTSLSYATSPNFSIADTLNFTRIGQVTSYD